MTKTDATAKRDEFMRTVNGSGEPEVGGIRPVLLREFIDQKYLPFQRGKWKKSTQGTSETADQRGHGVGVAIEEYTKTSVKDKAAAAKKLEEAVLGKEKIVRMPPRKAS